MEHLASLPSHSSLAARMITSRTNNTAVPRINNRTLKVTKSERRIFRRTYKLLLFIIHGCSIIMASLKILSA